MFLFVILSLCLSLVWASPTLEQHKVFPSNTRGSRIINGDAAYLGQFPWQAGLFVSGRRLSWFCGGSIISDEWILTAAHCVDGADTAEVRTGSVSLNEPSSRTNGTLMIIHERYNRITIENDIGLVKLNRRLIFDGYTSPVGLSFEPLEDDILITVSGWGVTKDGTTAISSYLEFVELVTITNKKCEETYIDVFEGIVCATSDTNFVKGTCNGDSGGPVVVYRDLKPVHVATVSFVSDRGCEVGYPSGYTRTDYYRDWITEKSGV